jgi:hypothetical protein
MEHRFFGKNVWLIPALVGAALAAFTLAPARARATTFTQVTSNTTRDTDPAPSPDGKWIAFTSDRCGHGPTPSPSAAARADAIRADPQPGVRARERELIADGNSIPSSPRGSATAPTRCLSREATPGS